MVVVGFVQVKVALKSKLGSATTARSVATPGTTGMSSICTFSTVVFLSLPANDSVQSQAK
ncbi:MAG: thiocillin family RiPP [Candidatus Limisoma sp.]